jgi:hypothetical protein
MVKDLSREIQTNFEEHSDGSAKAALVAQAARQNQHAQVMPVDTIEWIGIVQQHQSGDGSVVLQSRAAMLRLLEMVMRDYYKHHPDMEAYTCALALGPQVLSLQEHA